MSSWQYCSLLNLLMQHQSSSRQFSLLRLTRLPRFQGGLLVFFFFSGPKSFGVNKCDADLTSPPSAQTQILYLWFLFYHTRIIHSKALGYQPWKLPSNILPTLNPIVLREGVENPLWVSQSITGCAHMLLTITPGGNSVFNQPEPKHTGFLVRWGKLPGENPPRHGRTCTQTGIQTRDLLAVSPLWNLYDWNFFSE